MTTAVAPARPGPRARARWGDERGSVVAENALVIALLVLLFAALLQAGIVIHTRNVLIDAASAGARYGALADRDPADGAARAREALTASLPGQSGAQVTAETIDLDGAPTVRVTVSTSLPGLGFLPGPIPVEVHGHAHRF
ncbi:TadE/TadG family type IV pilus assembly protein [Micrococcus sp.]|uniref:TadE/TadG family type IV pilus assembly protein n=1 Tax=Micrococcus sp. TaxID=1271 RepID=UPI0026DAA0A1|nr:TadE/TadG family type IV pilus assembly protein [Micrococcus sp.]MDO4239110.1 TadE/TadG family type IV pilus assembly protein [Micrococcus sp.]